MLDTSAGYSWPVGHKYYMITAFKQIYKFRKYSMSTFKRRPCRGDTRPARGSKLTLFSLIDDVNP